MGKRIVLADPRGFCAGVDRAILTVRTILKSADTPRADGLPPVYVRRQIDIGRLHPQNFHTTSASTTTS